jgi:hypothetical protein
MELGDGVGSASPSKGGPRRGPSAGLSECIGGVRGVLRVVSMHYNPTLNHTLNVDYCPRIKGQWMVDIH